MPSNRRPKPNTFYPHSCPANQLEGLPDGYGMSHFFISFIIAEGKIGHHCALMQGSVSVTCTCVMSAKSILFDE